MDPMGEKRCLEFFEPKTLEACNSDAVPEHFELYRGLQQAGEQWKGPWLCRVYTQYMGYNPEK